MATPIGDAVVTVKIDTTQAEASLDRLDRRPPGGGDGRIRPDGRDGRDGRDGVPGDGGGGGRIPGIAPRGRPRTRPPTRGGRGIRRPGAIPLVGGILAAGVLTAEFGPAAAAFGETLTNRVLDEMVGNDTIKAIIREAMGFLVDQTQATAEKLATVEKVLSAAFGTLKDTTSIARTSYLFDGTVDAEELGSYLVGQFNIRHTLGMGRWAQAQVTRKVVGEGLANSIADLISTQE